MTPLTKQEHENLALLYDFENHCSCLREFADYHGLSVEDARGVLTLGRAADEKQSRNVMGIINTNF